MNGVEKILIDEESLSKRVRELAQQITEDYKDKPLLIVGILKGSVPFMADLFRLIQLEDLAIDFMSVSSYNNGTVSSGRLRVIKDLDVDISGKDVLIIEDIVDTGFTLSNLKDMLNLRNPASLKICTILNKPSRRTTEIDVEYIGFDVPDEFVIGYGLDYDEKYRNLPYVGVLKREMYEK
ncbi:MAG: hypoxanthine phosphoribosyltransferase [Eubacteriales bacterium]|nr:hypoxanthine phosphoribosyltransferase [Eubacteriales bacterium]